MTDTVQVALIVAGAPTLVGLIGLFGLGHQILLARQKQADDIHKIEKATNSMKDQLVEATREAALLQGAKENQDKTDAKIAPIGQ